jgi:peroxiredoxin
MPPQVGDRAPAFTALLCDGQTFRERSLDDVAAGDGCLLVFGSFVGSAIAENWWKRYDRRGWADLPVSVVGVYRDGPYAQNAFFRSIDSPFRSFSDVDGTAIGAFDLLVERDGMAGTHTARRAAYLLDADRTVADRWVLDDWISPMPADGIAAAVADAMP